MATPDEKPDPRKRGTRGFQRTAGLLAPQLRRVAETRGFAEMRLLTDWESIVGPETARIARPVKVTYARKGIGATLVVLCSGANAPILQMQLPQIRERVNAVYGYSAISRIQITQTAPTGFGAEPGLAESAAPFERPEPVLPEEERARLAESLEAVRDEGLKNALERLGRNVLTRNRTGKG